GVNDVVLERIGIGAAEISVDGVEGGARSGGVPIKGVVVNLYAVEDPADRCAVRVQENLTRIGAVGQPRIIRADVIPDDAAGVDEIVRAKHGDAVADGIMAVVVLDDIVSVPDVNVKVTAIPRTIVLNVV